MTEDNSSETISRQSLARLGAGHIAYIRPFLSDEVMRLFPNVPEMEPGHRLWALLAADGTPIMLADDQNAVMANAMEKNLATVSVH